jgi:hypothetical protein
MARPARAGHHGGMRSLFRWLLRILGLREAVEVYKALIRLIRKLR